MTAVRTSAVELVAKWTFWSFEGASCSGSSMKRSLSDSVLCNAGGHCEDDCDDCKSQWGDTSSVTTAAGDVSDLESTCCDRESQHEIASCSGETSACRWADVVDNEEPVSNRMCDHDHESQEACNSDFCLTTIMLRNIPKAFTRQMFTVLMDEQRFRGCYDFVHVPLNLQSHGTESVGYALVNMVCHEHGERLLQHFNGYKFRTGEFCEASWSNTCQGLESHVEKYRNSAVMHESVPAEHKPAVYHLGQWVPFSEPTRAIRAPRVRHAKNSK